MAKKLLVGYARKSKRGKAIKLDICLEKFLVAKRYTTKEGDQYVNLVVNIRALKGIIENEREVTSVTQLSD